MSQSRLQFVYDPTFFLNHCLDFDLDHEALRQAALGNGDVGFILGCGEGKDAQSGYAVDDIVKRGGATGEDSDRSNDMLWAENLQSASRMGLTCNRFNGATMLKEEGFAYTEIIGKTAFWPSVRGAFYEKHFLKPSGFSGNDLHGASWIPVWKDYVYRGMYTMAAELVGTGVRKLMIAASRGGEFSAKMNFGSDNGQYIKEDGFLIIAFDALKNVALENDVCLSIMLSPNVEYPLVNHALKRQIEVPEFDHTPFEVRWCKTLPGVKVIDFTWKIGMRL